MSTLTGSQWISQCLRVPMGTVVPTYGTPAWELCDDRRALIAATARAAECWRRHGPAPATVETQHVTKRMQAIDEANRPRPNDHPGGPVDAWEMVA